MEMNLDESSMTFTLVLSEDDAAGEADGRMTDFYYREKAVANETISAFNAFFRRDDVNAIWQRLKLEKETRESGGAVDEAHETKIAFMRLALRHGLGIPFWPLEWLFYPAVAEAFSGDDRAEWGGLYPLEYFPEHLTHAPRALNDTDSPPIPLPRLLVFALMHLEAGLPLRMSQPCSWKASRNLLNPSSQPPLIDICTRSGKRSPKTGRTATRMGDWALTVYAQFEPVTQETLTFGRFKGKKRIGRRANAHAWCRMGFFGGMGLIPPIQESQRFLPNDSNPDSLDEAEPTAQVTAMRSCVKALIPSIKAWGRRHCADRDGQTHGFFESSPFQDEDVVTQTE